MGKLVKTVFAVATVVTVGAAQAALIDRGGGMIYDTTLNITWLADMKYPRTSGYSGAGAHADGTMNWDAAEVWATNLVHGGFSDWRLPTLNPSDATCSDNFNPGGGFPQQHLGTGCTGGELSHLFVADLGTRPLEPVWIQTGDTEEQIANLALFLHVESGDYWSGTEYAPDPSGAWTFSIYDGNQGYFGKASPLFAIAVRDGDVLAVPEPATLALVAAALLGAAATRRRSPTPTTG